MNNKKNIRIEIVCGLVAIVFLIYVMRSMLIYGDTTTVHDNLYWYYPIYQFFIENIINWQWPLWNPFTHSGEPFYLIPFQAKLLDPTVLLNAYIGSFFTNDIVMLFNWNHFIQSLIMVLGVYIFFRQFTYHLFIQLTLIPILLYSSFFLVSFRQVGTFHQFMWFPYIMYFLFRIFYYRDYRWHNFLVVAVLLGFNWQSYFFTGTFIAFLFIFLGFALFRRDLLAGFFKHKANIIKSAVFGFIVIAMMLPNIVLMVERDELLFPAREPEIVINNNETQYKYSQYEPHTISSTDALIMSYSYIRQLGTFSNIWDFVQIISPDGNNYIGWPSRTGWGSPSDSYMYIGFLPWAIAVLGFVVGRHDIKKIWLLMAMGFALLIIGPPGGLHRLLYYIYPPLWFVRHTSPLVLFFLFTFLYFYVLGFNHIFFTWDRPLFRSDVSQGILSRFIKEEGICRGNAMFLFSACIVLFVYLMTEMTYPVSNYLFGLIALIFAVGYLLRKDLGEKGLYVSLILSHIAIVLIFTANTFKFLRYITPALGVPAALFIYIKTYKGFSNSLRHYILYILLFVFSASLLSDLLYSLKMSSFLYQKVKHPGIRYNIETTLQKPFLPQNRSVYPRMPATNYEQGMRYLSLVYRKPFVFSSVDVKQTESELNLQTFNVRPKYVFNELKNNSFESWAVSSDGNFLPELFDRHPNNGSPCIGRNSAADNVKDGTKSLLLVPVFDNCYIRYQSSNIAKFKGHYIVLSIWVKSKNGVRDAIQVDIQDGTGSQVVKSYNNSGDWERLELIKYINENATNVTVTLAVKSSANQSAYFDDAIMELILDNSADFKYALKGKKWNTLIMLKNYFKVINLNIPSEAFYGIFAIEKPMFQFKKKAILIDGGNISDFLIKLGAEKSVQLLQDHVLLERSIEQPIDRLLTIPDSDYKESIDFLEEKMSNGSGNGAPGLEKNAKFSYSIDNYNYNSFDMKVFAEDTGILYWSDGYDKYWHAYKDGKEVPIYQANLNFKAIVVQKGGNNIRFEYKPSLFIMSLIVFYGTPIVSFVSALLYWITIRLRSYHKREGSL